MDILVTDKLIEVFMISLTFSIIEMAFIQKIKSLSFITKSWQVVVINFVFSFVLGTLFSVWFFELNIYDGLWVSLFGFIGAPTIYEMLKKQNMINFTPKSLSDKVTISKENEIKRT